MPTTQASSASAPDFFNSLLVHAEGLFAGFADPAVITVIEILLIVQVLSRSALFDRLAGRIASARLGERATIGILCLVAAAISVFMNNIGALALMIHVIYGICQATGIACAYASLVRYVARGPLFGDRDARQPDRKLPSARSWVAGQDSLR